MKVSLEKEGTNVVKVGVEIESERAVRAYEVVCRQVSHRLRIPGFRPGKAPRNIVERAVGIDYLKREALEQLVPEALGNIIKDEKLDIITEPKVDSCDFELGQPVKLNATIEVRPEVKLNNYRGLKVTVEEAKMPDDAMDQALKNISESKSTLQTVDPRPIEMGDTALLDFECHVDGKLVDGGKAEGLLLEIKEGNFLEGFCEQLVGVAPGKSAEIKAKFPDTYRNSELAGKEAQFKVEVKEIRTRVLPAIDDELAKSIGQESLDKLKEALAARMEQEVQNENEARSQKAVVEAVVASSEVEIPETMIERETNLLLGQIKRYIEESGKSWQDFVNGPEYENFYKEKKEEARQRVLTSLVLGAVVRAEVMMVGDEESAPFLIELLQRYNVPVEKVKQDEQVRRAFDQLSRQAMEEALTQKVVQFLVSQSELTFVPETESPEAGSEEGEEKTKAKSGGAKKKKAETEAAATS